MDINDTDLAPVGGGTLRGPAAPSVSKTAGTFTPTRAVHPDEIWSPRGGEIAPPDRPLTPAPDYAVESERPVRAAYMGETPTVGNLVRDMHPVVRAALRPGIAG